MPKRACRRLRVTPPVQMSHWVPTSDSFDYLHPDMQYAKLNFSFFLLRGAVLRTSDFNWAAPFQFCGAFFFLRRLIPATWKQRFYSTKRIWSCEKWILFFFSLYIINHFYLFNSHCEAKLIFFKKGFDILSWNSWELLLCRTQTSKSRLSTRLWKQTNDVALLLSHTMNISFTFKAEWAEVWHRVAPFILGSG